MGKQQMKLPETTRRSDAAAHVRSRRYRVMVALAALIAVGGTVGAVTAGGAVARNDRQRSRQAFERSSTAVAATLQLAIQQENDLLVSASGYVAGNPKTSQAQFEVWAGSVHALARYRELVGLSFVVIVPADGLRAFAAREMADPPGTLPADGRFQVIPPGHRPDYCLSAATLLPKGASEPAGTDFCAGGLAHSTLASSQASGLGVYRPYAGPSGQVLTIQTPVYPGGVTPPTMAARNRELLGWTGMAVMPAVVLDRALRGHPGMAVSFRYRSASSDVVFSSGRARAGASTAEIGLHNGWTVTTFGPVSGGGLTAEGNALALTIAGVALSCLLGLLILVLATGRSRAIRLVAERTAELRGAQAELVDTARHAGMAEIATNVLHNVGNVLNSVTVSANLVGQTVRTSRSAGLSKAAALLHEHTSDLGDFLTTDPRGRALPGYLDQLATALASERHSIEDDLRRLGEGVAHITEIVNAQQSFAGVDATSTVPVRVGDVFEDALRMSGTLERPGMQVLREFPDLGLLALDRHRILLILVNLITNAAYAMEGNGSRPCLLSLRAEVTADRKLRIRVADNGEGIAPDGLPSIFVHGFTTHTDGHGFGLHSSALAAGEMGGSLTARSDGPGAGAVFTLEVPLERQKVPA